MKKLMISFFAFFFLLIISSCDILKPEEVQDDNPSDENAFTIGAEGGNIGIEGLSIVIPSGAFQETVNLKVYKSNIVIPEEKVVTPVYSIEGLPDNYSLPINVTIKLNGAVSNETYLVIQENAFVSSLNITQQSCAFFDATVTGDTIKGQIPANSGSNGNFSSVKFTENKETPTDFFSVNIFGSSNKRAYLTGTNHFKIIYDVSKDNQTDITNLGDYLETAYSKIKDIGFNLGKRTNWPVYVSIAELGNAYGLFTPSHWSINNGYLRFDRNGLSDPELMKTSAIHEFFHLAQYLYDYRGAFRQGSFAPDHYWFNEACSVWSEGLVSSSSYVSSNWLANQMSPFNGLQAGSSGAPEKHGYGMAPFIKYLTDEYGTNILVAIYEKLLTKKHVIDAINNSINYNLFLDCNEFFTKYSEGKIYPDFGIANLSSLVEDKFEINSNSNVSKTFTATYKGLSAKIYQVKLNKDFEEGASLGIGVDQDLCDITVFQYPINPGGNNILAKGSKNCVVPNLKNLRQQNKQLFVMIVNSNYVSNDYAPSSKDIKLTFSVNGKMLINYVLTIDQADFEFVYNDGSPITYEYGVEHLLNFEYYVTPENSSDSVFVASFDITQYSVNYKGNLKITFLNSPRRASYQLDMDVVEYTYYTHHYLVDCEVPFNHHNDNLNMDSYSLWGTDVSSGLINYSYSQDTPSGNIKLIGYNFGNNASLQIEVYFNKL